MGSKIKNLVRRHRTRHSVPRIEVTVKKQRGYRIQAESRQWLLHRDKELTVTDVLPA